MEFLGLDRETVLDLVVNFIPLAMIVFFLLMIAFSDLFIRGNLFAQVTTIMLHLIPIVTLAVVSYVAGRRVQRAEGSHHERE